MIRVAVVDDHPVVLDGVRARLAGAGGIIEVVATVTGWAELLLHAAFPVDVVVLDVSLGDDVPLEVKITSARAAGSAVVVLTSSQDPRTVREAARAGALAFLVKTCSTDDLVEAIARASRGMAFVPAGPHPSMVGAERPALSPQERRVLALYASGLAMKSVARELGIAEETARTHLKRVRDKYSELGIEARTKVELFRQATRDGWMSPD